MKNNRILALSGNDIFSGGGLAADLATYTLNGLHGFVANDLFNCFDRKWI